jgi:hypothetical protein
MRVELPGIGHWRHDLAGCLHSVMAVLLRQRGADPLAVLGAGWGFALDPDDVRREEYYLPHRRGSLLAGLAPYHPVSSRWHSPTGPDAGWQEVRARVAAGEPVAVAVDNFHLPFRPAYRDVHTNHLVTVYGFDDERGEVLVADPVPPRFQGPITLAELRAARDSANPVRHDRDMFFTDNPIGNRWLEVSLDGDLPPFDRDLVRRVVAGNAAAFREPADADSGLAGQSRFLARTADGLAAGRQDAVDTGFVVAAPVLAVTAVHADWLAAAARRDGNARLREAARAVDRVAHHWTAVRILVATARSDPRAAAEPLRRRARRLTGDHERALALLDRATGE